MRAFRFSHDASGKVIAVGNSYARLADALNETVSILAPSDALANLDRLEKLAFALVHRLCDESGKLAITVSIYCKEARKEYEAGRTGNYLIYLSRAEEKVEDLRDAVRRAIRDKVACHVKP